MSYKVGGILSKTYGKALVMESLLNKAAGLKVCHLVKKRL